MLYTGKRILALALYFSLVPPGHSAQCPDDIQAGDCVANDLQPTGSQIINGPDACTIGETISLDLRVEFENGGGANDRYSVGFFVGDNGEAPIGGSSCTFDSLQPVGAPIDLTGGSGGFLELNGDACGDLSKSDPTYKVISLNNVACVDNNGDGHVDIGYVLSWANNGNQENCTDPLDPSQFQPAPPKCQAELEYDLPIDVEFPPSIVVGKSANPSTIRAPGGVVEINITIANNSPSQTDPITVTSIVDAPYGDLTNGTSCTLPATLLVGQSITCTFTTTVSGVEGDTFPDTVTVTGQDDEGNPVTGSDSALVTIIGSSEPPRPGDLRLQKYAIPAEQYEPGGAVTYFVLLGNASETPLVVTSLEDDIYGNLDGRGTCKLPITLGGSNPIYLCEFREVFTGVPGDTLTDVITARGTDLLPTPTQLEASDDATVTIVDLRSSLEVKKVANPASVLEPGADVEYTLYIQNASTVDAVTVNNVLDSRAGGLNSQCGLPFDLQPGEIEVCTFTDFVDGNAGDFVTNVVVVSGRDDDGLTVLDAAAASVQIVGADPALEVTKLALPPIAAQGGSDVTYLVVVENTSDVQDPVTVTSMVDTVQDNASTVRNLNTLCGLPRTLQPGERFSCSYTETVDGTMTNPVNSPLVNVVTASGVDDEGAAVSDDDDATVTFLATLPVLPELSLTKTAAPVALPEPGGDVTYTVLLANAGDAGALDLTMTSLVDDIYPDIDGASECGAVIGTVLATGETASCSFTRTVSGPPDPNAPIVDTVTGQATYDPGLGGSITLTASDTASVVILDLPVAMNIVKSANPASLMEPGGDVTFSFTITNTSLADTITLTSVTDSIYGDLSLQSGCDFNRELTVGESYSCKFTTPVTGPGGTQELNTVVAIGEDEDGNEVQATDQATVDIIDSLPSISTSKTASPEALPPGGGSVNFTFEVSNTSPADTLTIDSLMDSVFGDLDQQGTCSVPQVLPPGGTYSCGLTTQLTGDIGDTHLNEVTASGVSDDGVPVTASASAIVRFLAAMKSIPAMGQLALLVLVMALLFAGVRGLRRR